MKESLPPLWSSEQAMLMTHREGATLQVHSMAGQYKEQAEIIIFWSIGKYIKIYKAKARWFTYL